MINRISCLLICAVLITQFGCVGRNAYQKKVDETTCLTRDLVDMQRRNTELAKENEKLAADSAALKARVGELEAGKLKLEKLLSEKSDDAYSAISQLEKEKSVLMGDLDKLLRAREERVRRVSRVYESFLDRMKEEISGGRIAVSELRGKLTVSVREDALFRGDTAELSAAGRPILRKIAEILKESRESEIIVIVPYHVQGGIGETGEKPAKEAETSAGRAVAVARFLGLEGIDVGTLAAGALGRFGKIPEPGTVLDRGKPAGVEISVTARD